jgi:hypothetical protein
MNFLGSILFGIAHGPPVIFITDAILFFQDYPINQSAHKLSPVCRIYTSLCFAGFFYIICAQKIKEHLLSDLYTLRPYPWKLSMTNILLMSFFYATIVFYPTELMCMNDQFMVEKMLLSVPSTFFLVSLLECLGFYNWPRNYFYFQVLHED